MISNDTIKDLGVLIDNRLKFHDNISTVTKKANRILAILHKIFEYSIWMVELLLICINPLSNFRIWQCSLGTTLHS